MLVFKQTMEMEKEEKKIEETNRIKIKLNRSKFIEAADLRSDSLDCFHSSRENHLYINTVYNTLHRFSTKNEQTNELYLSLS